tara:strand:- start:91 stop:1191 length:1101 start_codon:yes stop_codon:yes gene_type:complete
MPLFEGTQQQYYGSQSFIATSGQTAFVLTFPDNQTLLNSLATMPDSAGEFNVTINGTSTTAFSFNNTTNTVTLNSGATANDVVVVTLITPDLGNYQYITMQQLINNFNISYVGEEKIIPKVRRSDVAFHAQRGLQEMSYDILRSEKSQELELGPNLKIALPHDYVNYVKLSWVDNSGIERTIYPARKTSNPTAINQSADFGYIFDSDGNLTTASDSDTWTSFSTQVSTSSTTGESDDTDIDQAYVEGRRYGITPEHAHVNGVYFIDNSRGYVHFSSDLSGKTIKLLYISDGLATEDEMIIHKLAEEAMYKYIAHAILATRVNIPEYIIARFKKERFAAMRQAKLRLSNFKSEEIRQVLRNKSKQIK